MNGTLAPLLLKADFHSPHFLFLSRKNLYVLEMVSWGLLSCCVLSVFFPRVAGAWEICTEIKHRISITSNSWCHNAKIWLNRFIVLHRARKSQVILCRWSAFYLGDHPDHKGFKLLQVTQKVKAKVSVKVVWDDVRGDGRSPGAGSTEVGGGVWLEHSQWLWSHSLGLWKKMQCTFFFFFLNLGSKMWI